MAVAKPLPKQFTGADFGTFLALSLQYNGVTRQTNPNLAQRVALKESLVAQMAQEIEGISLVLAPFSNTIGLMAGFARAIGETGTPHFGTFGTLLQFAQATTPIDYNLKWQIVRAFRTMNKRFPQNPDIGMAAARCIPALSDHADGLLAGAIAAMKSELGIQ